MAVEWDGVRSSVNWLAVDARLPAPRHPYGTECWPVDEEHHEHQHHHDGHHYHHDFG